MGLTEQTATLTMQTASMVRTERLAVLADTAVTVETLDGYSVKEGTQVTVA